MIYNDFSKEFEKSGILTADEMVSLLSKHGMNPKFHRKLIDTCPTNVINTWDRTR